MGNSPCNFLFLYVRPQQKHMVTARIHHNALFFRIEKEKYGSLIVC